MIRQIIDHIRWTYQYDPWITVEEYNDNPILSIFLLYVLNIFILRQFLNDMGMFFLTKRQCQKKLRKSSLKEALTYSRFRDEIPRGWIRVYWMTICFYPVVIIFTLLLRFLYNADPFVEYVIQLIQSTLSDVLLFGSIIIFVLFYSKGESFAYDRWLVDPKTRKAKKEQKNRRKEQKKRRKEMRAHKTGRKND